MKKVREFPFKKARRVTSSEVESARKAIENRLDVKRTSRGRPPKTENKYMPV